MVDPAIGASRGKQIGQVCNSGSNRVVRMTISKNYGTALYQNYHLRRVFAQSAEEAELFQVSPNNYQPGIRVSVVNSFPLPSKQTTPFLLKRSISGYLLIIVRINSCFFKKQRPVSVSSMRRFCATHSHFPAVGNFCISTYRTVPVVPLSPCRADDRVPA